MSEVTDFFFGKKDKGTKGQFEPTGQALQNWKLGVAQMLSAGLYPSQEYINTRVIPSTMNTLTASGLGRSGAVGEAVAGATLDANLELFKAMISGIGQPAVLPGRGTGQRDVGAFDWIEKLAPLLGLFAKT